LRVRNNQIGFQVKANVKWQAGSARSVGNDPSAAFICPNVRSRMQGDASSASSTS
jgi:hypothetical protein